MKSSQFSSVAVAVLVVLSVVSFAGTASAAGDTTIELSGTSDAGVGQTVTYDVVVTNASGGVGSAGFNVSVNDTSVAQISAVSVNDGFPSSFTTTSVASDGSSAKVQAAGGDTNDTGTVAVATVSVETSAEGAVALNLTQVEAGDEGGQSYSITGVNDAALTVAGQATPANFSVNTLSPGDTTVTRGDSINVSATVENTGGMTATQTVELQADTTVLASLSVSLSGGSSTTVEFTDVDTSALAAGNYTYGVYTENDSRTAILSVEQASGMTGSLSADASSISVQQTTTYDIVVANATNGIGSGDLTVAVNDTSVAQVTSVDVNSAFPSTFTATNVSSDGSTASVEVAGGNTTDTGAVTVATVTVRGQAEGSASLDVSIASLGDEAGNSYSVVGTTGSNLQVTNSTGAFVSADPSTEGDGQFAGDGLHQDVNGDGTVTFSDVTTLFNNLKSDAVQDNVSLFDFNGDGSVTFADMTTLFNALLP